MLLVPGSLAASCSPRSSGDRATASGAVCARSNRVGGTTHHQPKPFLTSGYMVRLVSIMCSHTPPHASRCRSSRNIYGMAWEHRPSSGLEPPALATLPGSPGPGLASHVPAEPHPNGEPDPKEDMNTCGAATPRRRPRTARCTPPRATHHGDPGSITVTHGRLRASAGQRRRRRPGADRATVRGARDCAFRDPAGNLIRNQRAALSHPAIAAITCTDGTVRR